MLGRETIFLDNLEGEPDEEVLGTFVVRFYTVHSLDGPADLPPEVFLPGDFEDRGVLEQLLRERAGRAVRTLIPQRGEKTRLVALAGQNARHLLEERKLLGNASSGRAPDALYELQELLELDSVPRTIVCFDVSHTQGTETVASAVTFVNGEPDRSEYRRFRIKGEWGNDDYASMHEAVARYFRRRLEEAKPLPDLVVIDGGKGQLGAARAALEAHDLPQLSVISLAKKEEEVFVPGRADPVRMPRRAVALRLLQRLRDEAHRFAITYNRKLRTRRTVQSELSQVPGVGAARQQALLERFGSMRALRSASAEEIAGVRGFGRSLAESVLRHLQGGQGTGASRSTEHMSRGSE